MHATATPALCGLRTPWKTDGRRVVAADGAEVVKLWLSGCDGDEASLLWMVAALPDLLAACERAAQICRIPFPSNRSAALEDLEPAVLAALAKAKGGPPCP